MCYSALILFAFLLFTACTDLDNYDSREQSVVLTCSRDDFDDRCCRATNNVCGQEFGKRLGRYLDREAFSNGECTGGGSGQFQCVHYAKDLLWHSALHFQDEYGNSLWSEPWQFAGRGIEVARRTIADGEKIFVFDDGGRESPRETDLLIYQNVDRDGNLLAPSASYPGHVSVVSGIRWVAGTMHLDLIEENLVLPPEAAPCDDNLTDARMRTVNVATSGSRYSVDSGVSNLRVIGWIRHPLAGIYGDTGWHEGGISKAFCSILVARS